MISSWSHDARDNFHGRPGGTRVNLLTFWWLTWIYLISLITLFLPWRLECRWISPPAQAQQQESNSFCQRIPLFCPFSTSCRLPRLRQPNVFFYSSMCSFLRKNCNSPQGPGRGVA